MNVLYLVKYAGKGGSERYVETLVRYLHGARIRAFFAYSEGGPLAERMEELGVPCRQLDLRSRFDFKAAKALAELCGEWSIDLVHCQFLREHYTALLAKSRSPGLRVVYTNHMLIANDAVTRLSNRWLDRRQDQMISVCNRGRELLMSNGWSGDRLRVVFNGVDPAAWAGDRGSSTLRRELGLAEDGFVMLYAALLVPGKGHSFLLDALKALSDRTSAPFTMVLAGDGPLLEEMKAKAARLGLGDRVRFLGYRNDMKNLYLGADLCVCPSESEALSYFIIESMASGVPVVATDVGGNPDIISPDLEDGLLVPYGDPATMAEALAQMMEDRDLRERCRRGALRAVEERFEIHKWMDDTFAVYEDALAR